MKLGGGVSDIHEIALNRGGLEKPNPLEIE